jgi:WD40 repeat protein
MPKRLLLVLVLSCVGSRGAVAQPASYAKQVRPFLAKYCIECHSGDDPDGGLNLESFKSIGDGGNHGTILTAGKPDDSRVVRLLEGKATPNMPPKKAKQPKADERAVLRAWIAAGAKDDTNDVRVALTPVAPKHGATPPVTALAYRPDGKTLAVGGYHEVIFVDPLKGDVTGRISGLPAAVTALAYSKDGKLLAVASGATATAGEVRLYAADKLVHTISAHRDLIYDLGFSPDGKLLATCGYDRLIRLWDTTTGKLVRELKDHSDAVYAVAFSPDGKLLASGAADRAVKVWDVATGKRLYTLGEPTDWVYAVAWHPDGKHLAAAGVDKSVRVWEATPTGGKIVHSVFAHEGPVVRLAYSADGAVLYTLSEDRAAKAWDAAKMVERTVYAAQPESPLALAVRPDHAQLAIGRYDGALVLLEEKTGKPQSQPLPAKPKPPTLKGMTPNAGTRDQSVRIVLDGTELHDATSISIALPAGNLEVKPDKSGDRPEFVVAIPKNVPAGAYPLKVKTPAGESASLPFIVDLFTPKAVGPDASDPNKAPLIAPPVTLVGGLSRAGEVHFFRLELQWKDEIGVQVITQPIGSKLDPVLQLTDESGRVVAESSNGLLGFIRPIGKGSKYLLSIRDRDYRPDSPMTYRIYIGPIPIVTRVFPMGVRRGESADVFADGVFLPDGAVRVAIPKDAVPGSKVPVNVGSKYGAVLGAPSVMVGEFPEVNFSYGVAQSPEQIIPVPGTANGYLLPEGPFWAPDTDRWKFTVKKGQRLVVEVNARRLGSALDSTIEVCDAKGKPVPRAVLRCVAKTYVTFRDHDSVSPGIRIEAWSELAINDYLLVGSELVRIRALPKNPDDDCQFFSVGGQRQAFLGTTPTFHAQNEPMYKVTMHPPGTTFPPNGLPVVTLYYRNDDGGAGFGKDSRLVFDPPADGEYQVRIRDARGLGGPQYAYRLTIRPPRPSFNVSFTPTAPAVSKGGALPITVNAERIDEYDGPIHLELQNLPPGFSAPATTIPAGENSTSFALFAEPSATVPVDAPPLKLIARATIDGNPVVREVTGAKPSVIEPGDIVTTTEQSAITVKPGGETRLTVHVARRNGFTGRIPLDVRGLPHGVRVLDIGLNGILITEKETTRTVVIYCEPWVQPTEHPIVVQATREGKNTVHAAKSVMLKVKGGD